jgi:hypothetical protein
MITLVYSFTNTVFLKATVSDMVSQWRSVDSYVLQKKIKSSKWLYKTAHSMKDTVLKLTGSKCDMPTISETLQNHSAQYSLCPPKRI